MNIVRLLVELQMTEMHGTSVKLSKSLFRYLDRPFPLGDCSMKSSSSPYLKHLTY